jgi:hypothetical protein
MPTFTKWRVGVNYTVAAKDVNFSELRRIFVLEVLVRVCKY